MSTEVATIDLSKYDATMAKQLGLQSSFDGPVNTLPTLKINKDFDDEAGNTLPPGTFKVTRWEPQEDGSSVPKDYFSKTAVIRIFANMFQVRHYDNDAVNDKGTKGKHINKTILVPDMGKFEMRDELGGVRCGKMRAKDRDGHTKAELDEDRKRQSYRVLYGVIKMDDAVDRQGNKVSLDWTPFQASLRGTNFMPAGDLLESLAKQNKAPYNHLTSLTLSREKMGDVVYYIVHFSADMQNPVSVTIEDGELMKAFLETIKAENEQVEAKYNAALGNASEDAAAAAVLAAAGGASPDLGSDLDDEIPF